MSTKVLEIHALSKRYKNVQALHNLSLSVEKGMIFGILGPNGSGKTTTLGILLGVLNATSGSFSWFNQGQEDGNRQRIGALLETPNFYPYLSAIKNLQITGKIKQVKNLDQRIEEVLKIVDLWDRRTSKFKTFSLGMKQRLAIAAAILNDPEVLVLDEPTNGLDPKGIAEIRQLIRDIASRGTTILLASHQLDEVEKVCTDVVILRKGEAIQQSSIGEVMKQTRQIIVAVEDALDISFKEGELTGVVLVQQKQKELLLSVEEGISSADINRHFFSKGIVLCEIREVRRSLEDQFLEIIER